MHNKSCLKFLLIILSLLLIVVCLLSCSNDKVISDKRLLMGTTVEITVLGRDKKHLRDAINRAFYEIKKIDRSMNYYDKDSQLSKLNNEAKIKPYKVDKDLYYIVDKCIKFGKITDGAFDITAISLDKPNGYKDIILNRDDRTIYFRNPSLKIDLSAAAKGYAVDKAISSLKKSDIKNALVSAGGDIRTLGKYKDKRWSIGIRDPEAANKIILTIKLTDKAVATSGNYLRRHIIDTKKNNRDKDDIKVLSSTVIADDCITADILVTSLFIMDKEGISLIDKMNAVEGLLIVARDKKTNFIESSNFNIYCNK